MSGERWEESAACAGMDVELFFPDIPGQPSRISSRPARAVCRLCPVSRQCLDFALSTLVYGIWADTDWDERDHLRKLHKIRPRTLTNHQPGRLR